jgi:hypothetical protein
MKHLTPYQVFLLGMITATVISILIVLTVLFFVPC